MTAVIHFDYVFGRSNVNPHFVFIWQFRCQLCRRRVNKRIAVVKVWLLLLLSVRSRFKLTFLCLQVTLPSSDWSRNLLWNTGSCKNGWRRKKPEALIIWPDTVFQCLVCLNYAVFVCYQRGGKATAVRHGASLPYIIQNVILNGLSLFALFALPFSTL